MELLWPILYPSLIGVACLAYLAWCVIRAAPKTDEVPPSDEHRPGRWRRDPRRPPSPRRGPRGSGAHRAATSAARRR
ncbi:MAG: hypothetical protein ACRDLL_12670 [Solirubrobacterales bacterium]